MPLEGFQRLGFILWEIGSRIFHFRTLLSGSFLPSMATPFVFLLTRRRFHLASCCAAGCYSNAFHLPQLQLFLTQRRFSRRADAGNNFWQYGVQCQRLLSHRAGSFRLEFAVIPTAATTRPPPLRFPELLHSSQSVAHKSLCICFGRCFATNCSLNDNNNPTPIGEEVKEHVESKFHRHVVISAGSEPDITSLITVEKAVADVLIEEKNQRDGTKTHDDMPSISYVEEARALIALGAIWYLPAETPQYAKPRRLKVDEATMQLAPGDYLRVHFSPRRFPAVHMYDWNAPYVEDVEGDHWHETSTNNSESGAQVKQGCKPGLVVAEDESKGWMVINKPQNVPVHSTVDNAIENVQACLLQARRIEAPGLQEDCYVGTPQRLDQNTSGLMVVATSRVFRIYYAELLHSKTAKSLRLNSHSAAMSAMISPSFLTDVGIRKVYRCLVCLIPTNATDLYVHKSFATESASNPLPTTSGPWSVAKAMNALMEFKGGKMIRHWLEPSFRAPKRFVDELPPATKVSIETEVGDLGPGGTNTGTGPAPYWQESLLKIKDVGQPFSLVGSAAGETLVRQLWRSSSQSDDDRSTTIANDNGKIYFGAMPESCQAVVELNIELLTGRTHQIRGQLSALGFPVVGDALYGGAKMLDDDVTCLGYLDRLALQCQQLEFLDPDFDGKEVGKLLKTNPSTRWNRFQLNRTWWTPFLEEYQAHSTSEENTNQATISTVGDAESETTPANRAAKNNTKKKKGVRPELLPNRVQLSPGKNKYILIRAYSSQQNEREENGGEFCLVEREKAGEYWFVKSASPMECGGAYHGNVAQELREWIEAAGYEVHVTGGGRIDYNPVAKKCVVYGFSYAFGVAKHELAAKIIQHHTGILASVDNTEGLY